LLATVLELIESSRDKDDEMPKRVWKVVETKAKKIRVVEAEEEREKRRRRKEIR